MSFLSQPLHKVKQLLQAIFRDGGVAIIDGVSTPPTRPGRSTIFVDAADGATKVIHEDGDIVGLEGGGGGLANVVEDLTPQLGGNLDPNGFDWDGDLDVRQVVRVGTTGNNASGSALHSFERTTQFGHRIGFLDGANALVTGINKDPNDDIIMGGGVVTGVSADYLKVTPAGDLDLNGNGVFGANLLQITDGITEPATDAGFSQLFTDTADGVLKVKHGDGTVISLESSGSGAGDPMTLIRKPADTSRASTGSNPTDDPHLTFAVEANSQYLVYAHLYVRVDPGGRAMLYRFKGPSDARIRSQKYTNAGGSTTITNGETTNESQSVAANAEAVANHVLFVTTTSAGTFRLQWSQSGFDTDATILQEGSVFRYIKIE